MLERNLQKSATSSWRTRLTILVLTTSAALVSLPAPAAGEAASLPTHTHTELLGSVIMNPATGQVFECDRPETLNPEGVLACADFPTRVVTHAHKLIPNPGPSPQMTGTGYWNTDILQSDGSYEDTCGYWHAELGGPGYAACDNTKASAKTVKWVIMHRCLVGGCSDHFTTGIVHSDILQPSSFEWWKNFQSGYERTGCQGTYGGASTYTYHQASATQDNSPTGCATTSVAGLMGGGVRYNP